ncbi:hypothetical protein RKD23_005763 [Streptomyces sp. SAI-170]
MAYFVMTMDDTRWPGADEECPTAAAAGRRVT